MKSIKTIISLLEDIKGLLLQLLLFKAGVDCPEGVAADPIKEPPKPDNGR